MLVYFSVFAQTCTFFHSECAFFGGGGRREVFLTKRLHSACCTKTRDKVWERLTTPKLLQHTDEFTPVMAQKIEKKG